jgi:hypothetical protein
MKRKTAEQLADEIRKEYKGKERGSEFPGALDRVVKAGGYADADPDEIIAVKTEVVAILRDLAA